MAEAAINVCETIHRIDEERRISPRIKKLRQLALSFANELEPTERGMAVMDSYDETRTEPMIIRRAKAVAKVLETQSLILDEGQLIAGRVQRRIPAHNGIHSGHEWIRPVTYPESGAWLPKDAPVSEEYRKRWEEWHQNYVSVNLFGIANVANSLAAIKKFVFDEKVVSLNELRDAMKNNFEGHERLRQMLLNRAPKYGNSDEYVDNIAAEEAAFYCDEVAKYPTPEGGRHHALIFGTSPNAVNRSAKKLGTSADGRKVGEPLAMSACPVHGTERTGATATLKSVASLDYTKAPGGISFILDLHPSTVGGESGLDKLVSLLKTYFEDGGMEIGLNIVSEEQLRKAQNQPKRYSHLMVRVFGFSTQFTSLSHELQEYVIEKRKQDF